jgi:hypothetical protein
VSDRTASIRLSASVKRSAVSVNRKENGFGLLEEDSSVEARTSLVAGEGKSHRAPCGLTVKVIQSILI